jgi:hypothetical protein
VQQEPTIPAQYTGESTDNHYSIEADTDKEAVALFRTAVSRLFDVNNWGEICAVASASFRLTDAEGNEIERDPQQGDHFRIELPAPGTDTGDGYDWVRIEKIEKHINSCAEWEAVSITVRPAPNPLNDKEDTAHFFSPEATSTFLVQREKKKLSAEVHGRNEKPNTDTDNTIDNIRNKIIGETALTGLSDLQWKQLVKGILTP